MKLIAPSILAANFNLLGDDIEMINRSEADFVHCDVMDGVFVPNISFGIPVIQSVNRISKKPLDVHLMIVNPEKYIEDFYRAGASIITVHYEVCQHLSRTVQQIKDLGIKASVCLNPHTPVSLLEEIIPELDMVLLMSVNPGFGGQKFIENTYQKVETLKQMILETDKNILIEVDGGVDLSNAGKLVHSGVDVLVAGNTVFSSTDPNATIKKLLTST
jgi:ribulose-phosphate 3-epimerase